MGMKLDLAGRVAFVTGASSGLGAQFAKTLADSGAGVVLAARRVERLKTLRAEIEANGGDVQPGSDGCHHSTQDKNRTIVLFSLAPPLECTSIGPRPAPQAFIFPQESCS